ncbi:MAG: hypothetical protein IT190_02980 [Microbacteriaceae bacterium]|nr:hypothetical protein [Microbacteriaceae bacterium]
MHPRYRVLWITAARQGGRDLASSPMGFRMLRPAALIVATLLLAGCTPSEPTVTPAPEPTTAPIFASDEEALAAATEAYAKYLEVSDAIAIDAGKDPDRIAPFVSPERFQAELEAFKELSASGNHQEGKSSFDGAILQQVADEGHGIATITFYVCLDQSAAKFIDSNGADITPTNMERRSAFEVIMSNQSSGERTIILEGMERWPGPGIC